MYRVLDMIISMKNFFQTLVLLNVSSNLVPNHFLWYLEDLTALDLT